LIEKLLDTNYQTLIYPNKYITQYISLLDNKNIVYYEIGVGIGATVYAVAKLLNNIGSIYIFSRKKDCEELKNDLIKLGYNNIYNDYQSENNIYSGYHFDIACGIIEQKLPKFDLAYLDGGHVFHLDAPTTCMLKELCKVDGTIVFDDYNWSLLHSDTMNPTKRKKTLQEYDEKQIKSHHIKMICTIFMDTDKRFHKQYFDGRCISYKKVSDG
jgi:hypothetical protein